MSSTHAQAAALLEDPRWLAGMIVADTHTELTGHGSGALVRDNPVDGMRLMFDAASLVSGLGAPGDYCDKWALVRAQNAEQPWGLSDHEVQFFAEGIERLRPYWISAAQDSAPGTRHADPELYAWFTEATACADRVLATLADAGFTAGDDEDES